MTRFWIFTLTISCLIAGSAAPALAGAKLTINDNATIDFGFRLQALGLSSDRDLNGDGDWNTVERMGIRRARFRLKGTVNEHVSMFFQTDVSGTAVNMIDAFATIKKDNWTQVIVGQNMAPSNRSNLTSSGALMAADRPAQTYKSMTWGMRALSTFNTSTVSPTDSGLRGSAQVRDLGITLFGSGKVGEEMHGKYYLGVSDGIQAPGKDSERVTARGQVNYGDAEAGYYNSGTYLGKKKTMALGASVDAQPNVAMGSDGAVDYLYFSVDGFVEHPIGDGSLTVEAAFSKLDLDGNAKATEGTGFYVEAGYYIAEKKVQPWFLVDSWTSDGTSDAGEPGTYLMWRAGATCFLAGQNANIKVGFEQFKSDVNLIANEDTINSILVGFYTTY